MTPRGIRNNNPGNIEKGAGWRGLAEDQSGDDRFAIFKSPVWGIRALCKVLLTYHRHRRAADGSVIDTVREYIFRWAPPSENDTDAYVMAVRMALDVEKGEIIDPENPLTLQMLAGAIIQHENGEQPYSQETLRAGVNMALGIGDPKPRKLLYGFQGETKVIEEPEPLDLWVPEGREEPVLLYVLPVESFKRVAVRFGYPDTISGLAVYKRWYAKDIIYVRVDRLEKIIGHEWRHIVTQKNFHGGKPHA